MARLPDDLALWRNGLTILEETTMAPKQAVLFYDGTTRPMARILSDTPTQATMMLGTCDAVAALASKQQIPQALLDVLAGYALAGLDANRQAAILADLGTGRIVSVSALTKRCKTALAAQAQDATFAWGR
jgi:hypothetical protein